MKPVRQQLNTTNYDPCILIHPNIPKPLHGLNPRTIMGQRRWLELTANKRNSTHFCEACGASKITSGTLECHEEYDINYEAGTSKLVRIVAICKKCHEFIHCGRLKALTKSRKISRRYYLMILKRGREILKKHKIRKIKYRGPVAPWGEWKLIFEGKEYQPIHKNMKEWKDAYMKKGFTLIELIVALTVVIAIASIVIVTVSENGRVNLDPILMPKEAQAQAQQRLAEEMAEQNRIMREILKQNAARNPTK